MKLETKQMSAQSNSIKFQDQAGMTFQIDYVLQFRVKDNDDLQNEYRKIFEKMMVKDGLITFYETCHDSTFIKIHCPVERLSVEAERVRLEMPLKGCDIPNVEPKYFASLRKWFKTDNEVDFVSGPFYSDRVHLYEGSDDPSTLFRTAVRSFLVHHILINLDMSKKLLTHKLKRNQSEEERRQVDQAKDDVVSRIGLPYLLMKKIYCDSFIPHDMSADDPHYNNFKKQSLEDYYSKVPKLKTDARRELNQTWTKWTKFQPLWKIRNYFGEEIALYFAFQGTFISLLWIPSILGLICFIYGLYITVNCEDLPPLRPNDTAANQPHGCYNSSHGWDLEVFHHVFDNKITPFISLMICIWSSFFIEAWRGRNAKLAYEWDCDVYEDAEPDRPEFVGTEQILDPVTKKLTWIYPDSMRLRKYLLSGLTVASMIMVVFISVCSVTLLKLAMCDKLNCTKQSPDGKYSYGVPREDSMFCLVMVTLMPTVLNAISILILGLFYEKVAKQLTMWENHRTSSEHKDALIIKLFAFHFVNTYTSLFYIAVFRPKQHGFQDGGLFNMGPKYIDSCDDSCMSLLSLQVLSLMIVKPMLKYVTDLLWPWLKLQYRAFKQLLAIRGKVDDEILSHHSSRPASAMDGSPTVDNFFEREFRKPRLQDFTITEYSEKVIEFGYIVMFAASFPLAPLLALIINFLDLRIDARRLLWFNRRPIAFITTDIGMWFPILRFVSYCGVLSNAFIVAFTSSFCEAFFERPDVTTSERLFVVLVFEHVVFIIMYILHVFILSKPTNISLAQRRERYEVARILEENKEPTQYNCDNCNTAVDKSQPKQGLWLPNENDIPDETEIESLGANDLNQFECCRNHVRQRQKSLLGDSQLPYQLLTKSTSDVSQTTLLENYSLTIVKGDDTNKLSDQKI